MKSNMMSKLYVLLNIINMAIGISILYFLMKYREYKKGGLKESLRKRISILSEHYSFNTGDKRKSKLKNSNSNTPMNSNNNSSNYLNVKEDAESMSFGNPVQFLEPESYEDSNSDININMNNSKNDKNNNDSNTNQTSGHITYNIPLSPTASNMNVNESQSVQNIASLYINGGNEIDKIEEEEVKKRKKMIKWLFASLIIISFVLGFIGVYYIIKWIKEEHHIGMEYKNNAFNNMNLDLDKSLGVSLILITIATFINIIIGLYMIILICIIHFSKSKIYWSNEGDDDTYSQSFDSINLSNSYNPNNNYNPTTYNN